jgi:hypothetical protein
MMPRWLTPALAILVPSLAPACSAAPAGEIVIALQTDVAIPKDIDAVRIQVVNTTSGKVALDRTFNAMVMNGEKSLRLPGTVGVTASNNATDSVRIRVTATRGAITDTVAPRILRELTTTVPADKAVTVPIPLEFLCDGKPVVKLDAAGQPLRDSNNEVVVTDGCGDGETCVAGRCASSAVASTTLQAYDAAQIFGGGTGMNNDGDCFDPAACFDDASPAAVDLATCQIAAGGGVNVGLVTQGAGSCGAHGCFVALDAESDAGWKTAPGGAIALTPAVCDKVKDGTVVAVVTSPVGKSPCAQKRSSLPSCGPFTSSGRWKAPDPAQPVIVASGQVNPAAVAFTTGGVYWIGRGTFDKNGMPNADGTVKIAPTAGGQAELVASGQASPHDLAVNAKAFFLLWTNAASGQIELLDISSGSRAQAPIAIVKNAGQPEGVASITTAGGTLVAWTDPASNQVNEVKLSNGTMAGAPMVIQGLMASAPTRIAVAGSLTCWTYEDKLDTTAGAVACNDGATTTAVASQQKTPRSIAVDPAGMGTVYFADFGARAEGGGIYAADKAVSGFSKVRAITQGNAGFMDGEDFPNGLAVDAGTVYWTSRTRGAVMRWDGKKLTEIASAQSNPGAVAVSADAVYWVNEGTPDKADGAIMKLPK